MPPTSDDIQRYVQCMEIIKLRIEVINKFLLTELSTGMPIPDIECICLQFRMVFESIALSSLCAHRARYEQIKKRFSKEWDANKIIKAIESFNPDFYPVPIVQILDASGKSILGEKKRDGFMTRNEYQKAFNRCHDFLHEQNPYDWKQPNVTELWTMFTEWKSKIISLLDCHIIPFETDQQLFWVVMKAVSDGKVREDSVVVKQMTKGSKVIR